jgi:hypothetical protein
LSITARWGYFSTARISAITHLEVLDLIHRSKSSARVRGSSPLVNLALSQISVHQLYVLIRVQQPYYRSIPHSDHLSWFQVVPDSQQLRTDRLGYSDLLLPVSTSRDLGGMIP